MAFINACISDSSAPYKEIKKVQFGILSPDEIVSGINNVFNGCVLHVRCYSEKNVGHN